MIFLQDTASTTSLDHQQQATAVSDQTAGSEDPARTITYSTPSRNSTGTKSLGIKLNDIYRQTIFI